MGVFRDLYNDFIDLTYYQKSYEEFLKAKDTTHGQKIRKHL